MVGQGTAGAAQDTGKVGKESSVPQELATTIDELKAFIKEEKDVSSDVSTVDYSKQQTISKPR